MEQSEIAREIKLTVERLNGLMDVAARAGVVVTLREFTICSQGHEHPLLNVRVSKEL